MTPAPDTPPFRLFLSGDTALIRCDGAEIEMPVADALALADAIIAALRPVADAPSRERWTATDDAELTRLYLDGWSARQIAVKLGRTQDAVARRRIALGIAAKNPKSSSAARARWQERRAAQ